MESMDPVYQAPQGRLLPLLVTVLFVLGLFYGLFLFFEKTALSASVKQLSTQQTELKRQLSVLEDQDVQVLFTAQEIKAKFDKTVVRWSTVIRNLQRLTPVGVFFSNYGLSEDGSIQISGLGNSFGSVSDLISALTAAPEFEGAFVPTLTLGSAVDGQTVVSFSVNLRAVQP